MKKLNKRNKKLFKTKKDKKQTETDRTKEIEEKKIKDKIIFLRLKKETTKEIKANIVKM